MDKLKAQNQTGFTLIEVMTALAVVAVGLAAVVAVVSSIALNTSRLEEKAISQWLISNRLAEIRMARLESSQQTLSTSSSTVIMGGREWYIFDNIKSADSNGISEVSVQICTDSQKSSCPLQQVGFFSSMQAVVSVDNQANKPQ